jgi:Uma2 family endonuclease
MLRPPNLPDDLVTFDEFCSLVPDGQKADLIDGVIYMASPDMRRSDKLTNFVHHLLQGFNDARGLGGEVFGSRFAFKITEIRAPEPDVAYVCPERLHLVSERHMNGGPDIAVEIVTRDSRDRDYGEKRRLYQEAGVREYWIIDPIQQCVEFLRLGDRGYDAVRLERSRTFHSRVLPEFWMDLQWLLAYPVPNSYQCLQQILAGHKP